MLALGDSLTTEPKNGQFQHLLNFLFKVSCFTSLVGLYQTLTKYSVHVVQASDNTEFKKTTMARFNEQCNGCARAI